MKKLCAAEVASHLTDWVDEMADIGGYLELSEFLNDRGYEVQPGTAEEVLREFVNKYVD